MRKLIDWNVSAVYFYAPTIFDPAEFLKRPLFYAVYFHVIYFLKSYFDLNIAIFT